MIVGLGPPSTGGGKGIEEFLLDGFVSEVRRQYIYPGRRLSSFVRRYLVVHVQVTVRLCSVARDPSLLSVLECTRDVEFKSLNRTRGTSVLGFCSLVRN